MTATTTTGWDVVDAAHHALRTTVHAVAPDAWGNATPCELWTATQVLQHAAGDQLAYVQALTGTGGPAANPFEPSGALETTPTALVDQALAASVAAWSQVGHDSGPVPTPLPHGSLDPAVAAGACALDAAVHAWDIAVGTGQPSPLTPDLSAELMPVARAVVEPLRTYGAYAAALEPQPGDDATAALLRYLGRDPQRWS